MTHAFFKALLFLCAGAVMHAMKDEADIFKMGGLRKKMPVTFATMAIGVLAISGLPPFAGFFSKDEILVAASTVSTPLYLIATVTAFMTAFYMARLLFVAFMGEPKEDCPAHEVCWSMKIPLIILAGLAIVSGMWGQCCGFGDWVRYGAPLHEGINIMVAGTSTVLSLIALWLAWNIYVSKRWSADAISKKFGVLYTLSYHKYYIDEFYAWMTKYFVDGIGKILYWVDIYIVDGIVNGMAYFVSFCSYLFTRLQNGQVQRYAAVFFCGVILLIAYSLVYAHKVLALLGGAF